MFTNRIPLFTLFGIKVGLDYSWFLLAILLVWSLMAGYFPWVLPGLGTWSYLWMAILGAAGLFASIIFHEFGHALVARRFDLPISRITLFIFGGVAEMDDEPPNAIAELRMAVAGPVMSVLISIVCYMAYLAIGPVPVFWSGVLAYLALINILLAAFNMLPAFPLDGGRVLRAYLWGRRRNLASATRTASSLGAAFGAVLIVMAVVSVVLGNFIGGMWWFLLGLFLRSASKMSYRQLEMKQALAGEPVSRFMRQPEATVPPSISLQELIDDYFYRYYMNVFPVTQGSRIARCVDVRKLKTVPRGEWAERTVAEVAEPCAATNTIPPDTDAIEALTRMTRAGRAG
jgi:Zn-dependent protease